MDEHAQLRHARHLGIEDAQHGRPVNVQGMTLAERVAYHRGRRWAQEEGAAIDNMMRQNTSVCG